MAGNSGIERFLQQAWRRHVTNLTLEYLTVALACGAVGVILLLIAGTQLFDWYWPVVLFAGAAVAGAIRARRKAMSPYRLAQVVDAHLNLNDRLSTVVYFRAQPDSSPLQTVEHQASELLSHADVRQAVPVQMPRHAYAAMALFLAAAGLLGARYGMLKTLDLSAPIAQIEFGIFQEPAKVQAASKKSVIQERFEEQLRQLGLNVDDAQEADERALQPQELTVPAQAEAGEEQVQGKREGKSDQPESGEQGEEGEQSKGDGSDQDAEPGAENRPGEKPNQAQPQNAKQNQAGSNDSLMDKMKDALSNLLNKMKMQGKSEQQQASLNPATAQGKGQQQQAEKGMQSKASSQGEPNSNQQGDQDGNEGEKMAGNQSKGGQRDDEKPGSEDSKSGIGKNDGDKGIREAEQLAAMGKLSEIFGKRAQQLTGEITVEVSSGKQHLKTAYSNRAAAHADTGAEVARDEIPLMYQSYVKRYFEEVRKTAPKQAPPVAATP